jgi:hypothetical protein
MKRLNGEEAERRRGAKKVPAALLLYFPASVRPTAAERGGATRIQ